MIEEKDVEKTIRQVGGVTRGVEGALAWSICAVAFAIVVAAKIIAEAISMNHSSGGRIDG